MNKNKKILNIVIIILAIVAIIIVLSVLNRQENNKQQVQNLNEKNTIDEENKKVEGLENIYTENILSANEENITNDQENETNTDEMNKEIKLNETIVIAENCEFTIIGFETKQTVKPPAADGYYTSYGADPGKKFLDIIIDVKNLKETEVKQDAILKNVKLEYNKKNEYEFFAIVEKDNGEDFNGYPSLYNIKPLETLRYHFLVQIQGEIENDDKELIVKFLVDENNYIFRIR